MHQQSMSYSNMQILLVTTTTFLFLLLFTGSLLAQAPAFCPVAELTRCHHVVFGNCTDPKFWHGIDSLEGVQVAAINETHVSIRSLRSPPTF